MAILDVLSNLASRVVVLVGGYGSGKSEIALNMAFQLSESQPDSPRPIVIDLDVVKPMFRARELMQKAACFGVEIVAPEGELALFETPALNPRIFGALLDESRIVLVDVGGDDRGARALGSLLEYFPKDTEVLLVVNARRPFSANAEGMVSIAHEIEEACRMKITGLVSNTHLGEWTDVSVIDEGHAIAQEAAERLEVPIRFLGVRKNLADKISVPMPILPLDLQIQLPWEYNAAE